MEEARWALIFIFIATLIGCADEPIQECLTVDAFVDRVWVVTEPQGLDDICYLFSSDRLLVTKDEYNNISITENWSTNDTGCLETVVSGDTVITITGIDESGCIVSEYEGKDLTVCDCQY